MTGLVLIELGHAAEEERIREAASTGVRARASRENWNLDGRGRTARAWAAFWAPRNTVVEFRKGGSDTGLRDLTICVDC